MIVVKCIRKFRDDKEKIYGYRLQDLNGMVKDVTPEQLKTAILNKQVSCINLTLTKDNRLVDCKEKQLESIKEFDENVDSVAIYSNTINKVCANLGFNYDSSLVEKSTNDELSFTTSRKIMNTDVMLVVNVYCNKKLVDAVININFDGIYVSVNSDMTTIQRLVKKMDNTPAYFKTHVSEFLGIMLSLSDFGNEEPEEIYPRLIKYFATNLGIIREVTKYFEERRDNMLNDKEFMKRLDKSFKELKQALEDIHSYDSSPDYLMKYCIIYNCKLDKVPDVAGFTLFMDGIDKAE